MRKINLPLLAVLALFASLMFSSCKKDYTCACDVGIPTIFDTVINIQMNDFTKKQAKKACENNDETIRTVTNTFIAIALGSIPDSLLGGQPITIPPNIISASCELK